MARNLATLVILGALIAALVVGAEAMGVRLFERVATSLCISLVLVLGLQVFMGNSGILSFAHIGFMGVGAYTSAVLTIPAQMKGMALPGPLSVPVRTSSSRPTWGSWRAAWWPPPSPPPWPIR